MVANSEMKHKSKTMLEVIRGLVLEYPYMQFQHKVKHKIHYTLFEVY